MTAVSYHDTVNDLQGLGFVRTGPFNASEWFGLLERAGTRPLVALARDGDEAAALVLTRAGAKLQGLTNWYAFTWTPLATAGADKAAPLMRALARGLARSARRVELSKLPDEDGTATRLERAFRAEGWIVVRETCDTNHILEVGGRTFAQYLAGRPGPLRTTLRRKAAKVAVTIADRFDADAWHAYQQIYRESWKPEEGDPETLRRFAEGEGAAGRLRMALARHDGRPVAAQMWTIENGTAYIHKLAHLEQAKSLSPGTTVSAALFEHAIDRSGAHTIDFGTGDDRYKRDWMEQVRPRFRLTCWRPGDPRNWPAIARATARKLVSPAPSG